MDNKTIEDVREFFSRDRFATENGAVIDEIGDHYAKCSLKLGGRHKNAMGGVMGGVHFTLADFAFAVASNWQNPGTVCLSANIAFLGVAKGDSLIAEAICIKEGRTTSYYRADIRDNLGNPVAAATMTGFRKG